MEDTQTPAEHKQWWQVSASPVKQRYLDRYAIGRTALDLGTGAGHYAQALEGRGFQVIGLDLDPLKDIGVSGVQARLNAIPFANPFDTVLAFDVLEHEADERGALRELRRLTGRRLLLSVPNADDRLLIPYNLTYKHHIDKTHQREYQEEELRRKVEQAGFHILHINKEGPVSPAFLAEFIPVKLLRGPVRLVLKGLHRLHMLYNPRLMADLYVVAEPA